MAKTRLKLCFAAFVFVSVPVAAIAAPALPYSNRTLPYSGYSSSVTGDLGTVGMAGSVLGAADTVSGFALNPAGLAMTLNSAAVDFTVNSIVDRYLEPEGDTIQRQQFGIAFAKYPWGFGFAYRNPFRDGAEYADGKYEVAVREYSLSGARVFLDNRLALGFSLVIGAADRKVPNQEFSSTSLGATLGIQVQFPGRFIGGVSFISPRTHAGDPSLASSFFRDVRTPSRFGMGLGWYPNRFFKSDVSLLFVGPDPGTALLRDEVLTATSSTVLEPHAGASYQFADFRAFSARVFWGMYLEVSRTQVQPTRMHFTSGLDVRPWVFNLGLGADWSSGYQNFLVSFSLNLLRSAEVLDLIPRTPRPDPAGWLPDPRVDSDAGLQRPLVRNWVSTGPDLDPLEIARELPGKALKKIENTGKEMKDLFEKRPSPTPSPSPSVQPSTPPHPKAKRAKSSPKRKASPKRRAPQPEADPE